MPAVESSSGKANDAERLETGAPFRDQISWLARRTDSGEEKDPSPGKPKDLLFGTVSLQLDPLRSVRKLLQSTRLEDTSLVAQAFPPPRSSMPWAA